MNTNETFSRVHALYGTGESGADGLERRDATPRSRVQKTGRCEPAQARAETKGQTFRFPRPCLPDGRDLRFFVLLPGEFIVRQALSDSLANEVAEALRVFHRQTIIEPKCL